MKTFALVAALTLMASTAYAQNPTCKAQATEKKLAGAALNSFMQKCERDAQNACDKSAGEKKLAGAAKNSYTTKCVRDTVGN